MTAKPRRTRRRVLVTLAMAALVPLIASCYYGPDPTTSFTEMYNRGMANGPWHGMLPWVCHSEGLGGGHGGEGMANPAYAGMTKGDLSWDDCGKVVDFLDKAWAAAKKYPTRGDAKKAGAVQAVQFVPTLGTHDMIRGVNSIGFDPAHPMFYQYDGMGDDARLAGMSWLVYNGSDTVPPDGLPGNNDWWHTHSTLCYSGVGVVIGNEISDAQCTAMGGTNRHLPGIWMLHAWIVPGYEDERDVFAGAYACVKGTGPAASDDPCHDQMVDMEHGNTGSGGTTTTMPDMPGMSTTTLATTPSTVGMPTTTKAPATTTTMNMPMPTTTTMNMPMPTTTKAPTASPTTTVPPATTTTMMNMDHSH